MTVPFCVALTGGIGSGKSTVSDLFLEKGVPIIDSDIVSRKIVEPGQPALKKIISFFGNKVLNEEGTLNRKKLKDIIFNDTNLRKKRESFLHPSIYNEIDKQISLLSEPYCIVVIPLLFETNMADHFDRILLVDVPEEVQIERTVKRDKLSHDEVINIINTQQKRDKRIKHADDIIDNTVKNDELRSIVDTLHTKYLELAKKKSFI